MMTQKEIANLVGLATANFPNMQDKDMRPTANLWLKLLGDIPYEIAENALLKVLSTAKYFPTVAEIREAAISLTTQETPSAIEGWGELMVAVRRHGYYGAEAALDSLSPITRKVAEMIGWAEICHCEEIDVLRGQFRMAYEQYAKREKEAQVLLPELRGLLKPIIKELTG
jgi:hypothetical protein